MGGILQVKNISKTYGQITAVDGISFTVQDGELFAFLGQNGAGKSTAINIIIGLVQKDGGQVVFDGDKDIAGFKNNIGVVFQDNMCDDNLTVAENLRLYARLYNTPEPKQRFNELVKTLSLESILKQKYKTLSGGQKRKVEIARALWNNPRILFLDEPTTGLDPKTRKEVWAVI